ncbi:EamA-like transporter family protein [mine drainage metagenome]|uniref:EamA-like transporter family protein n=1 Tax=mine drainage metagenome TaxID=410659 RepID=A0A1J5RIK6_9ZZZZ
MHKDYLKGVFFCLVATLAWGGMFPVMTDALKNIDPFTFTALRYSIAGTVFIFLLYSREGSDSLKLKHERILLLWALGTAGFAGFGFLVFWGQQLAGASGALTASIMMATMPLLGLLVNWVIRGVRPPIFSFGFITLSFFGVALVITKGHIADIFSTPQNYSANIPLILGALCWVVYTVGASFFPKWSPYRYTAVTTLLGLTSIFVIVFILIGASYIKLPTAPAVIAITPHLLYMSLVAGFIGVLSWNLGNKIITPMNGVLFMDVVPVTAFTISTFNGIVPENSQILGACITATALIFNNLYQRRRMLQKANVESGAFAIRRI